MTTIPSRIGPVLDWSVDAAPPRVGAEPHRVESFAVGSQPVLSSVGVRGWSPTASRTAYWRRRARARTVPEVSTASRGANRWDAPFRRGAIPPLPAVGIRLWRRLACSARVRPRRSYRPTCPRTPTRPSGCDLRQRRFWPCSLPARVGDRTRIHPPWLVLPGWARRASSSVPSPRGCYAGAAAKRAFGSASWRPLRELIPSLLNTLRRCHSTVRALM